MQMMVSSFLQDVGYSRKHEADHFTMPGDNWPELLQTLFLASQSPEAGQREGAFRIFTVTPGIIQKQHEETVLGAFTKGFKDSDVTVQILSRDNKASLMLR